jgi:hypothetical protein
MDMEVTLFCSWLAGWLAEGMFPYAKTFLFS